MKCSEIIQILNELAPEAGACSWDNPGLLAGRSDKEVKCIYIALDATDQVVDQAAAQGADLLLTHHPLIFKALKQINDQNFITRRLLKLIQADISCYAMHTNFDAAPGCMADLAAKRLNLTDCSPLEYMGEMKEQPYGIGKVGMLPQPVSLFELANQVKEAFGLPFLLVYGQELKDRPIQRAALCPGSGGSMIEEALKAEAQVMITGDIGHHTAIDAVARNLAVIDAGHYGLEHIFIDFMADYLEKRLQGQVKIIQAAPQWQAVVI